MQLTNVHNGKTKLSSFTLLGCSMDMHLYGDWNLRRSSVKMAFKRSKETKWNQIKLNFYKYWQTKEIPITGDGKHGDLFHKKIILN